MNKPEVIPAELPNEVFYKNALTNSCLTHDTELMLAVIAAHKQTLNSALIMRAHSKLLKAREAAKISASKSTT